MFFFFQFLIYHKDTGKYLYIFKARNLNYAKKILQSIQVFLLSYGFCCGVFPLWSFFAQHLWRRQEEMWTKKKEKKFFPQLCFHFLKFCGCFQNLFLFLFSNNIGYNFSTFRQNCPFFIRFRVSNDGHHLEVVELQMEHNHDVSQVQLNLQ